MERAERVLEGGKPCQQGPRLLELASGGQKRHSEQGHVPGGETRLSGRNLPGPVRGMRDRGGGTSPARDTRSILNRTEVPAVTHPRDWQV